MSTPDNLDTTELQQLLRKARHRVLSVLNRTALAIVQPEERDLTGNSNYVLEKNLDASSSQFDKDNTHHDYFSQPLLIFFLAISVAIGLIVLRFYVEYLVYIINGRTDRRTQMAQFQRNVATAIQLRTQFDDIPPPPPAYSEFVTHDPPPTYDEAAKCAPQPIRREFDPHLDT